MSFPPNQGGGPYGGPPANNQPQNVNNHQQRVPAPGTRLRDVYDIVQQLLTRLETMNEDIWTINENARRTDNRLDNLERMQQRFNSMDNYLRGQVSSINTNARLATNNVTRLCESTQNIVQENQHNLAHCKDLLFSINNATDEIKFDNAKRKREDSNFFDWNKKVPNQSITYGELRDLTTAFSNSLTQPTPSTFEPGPAPEPSEMLREAESPPVLEDVSEQAPIAARQSTNGQFNISSDASSDEDNGVEAPNNNDDNGK